jgi:LacI family transcriptional regulator
MEESAKGMQMRRGSGKRGGGARVTLHDVAKAADVSVMTVSNFVNGKRTAMSKETRSRVAEEIRRLNYRPNTAARNLRMSKRFSIGMIIVDDEPNFLSDPFTTQILAGLTNTLSRAGYGMQVQGVGVNEFTTSPIVNDIRTDGICVLLSGPSMVRRGVISTLLAVGQPLVVLQESLRIPDADLCLIRQADRDGGGFVAQAVLRTGARQLIALVPACEWAAIEERVAGMKEAVDAEGNGAILRVVHCGRADFADTQAALERDIAEHGIPAGILAGNDQMGIAALKLVLQKGLRVPQDIVISGFNAFEFWQYSTPQLTSVRSQAELMGTCAGEQMLSRLATGQFDKSEITFPISFVPGETC